MFTDHEMRLRRKSIDETIEFIIGKIPENVDMLVEEIKANPKHLDWIAYNFACTYGGDRLYGHDLDPIKTKIWSLYIE